MKQTTNYKLYMPEMSDALSPTPLNENAQLIDTALKELNDGVVSRLKIVYGSYAGNGNLNVSIPTPGIKPQALLMRSRRKYSAPFPSDYPRSDADLFDDDFTATGFVMWVGQDIQKTYWVKGDDVYDRDLEVYVPGYKGTAGYILFTSENGKISWKLSGTPTANIDHSCLVNNESGYEYDWIAFGTEG